MRTVEDLPFEPTTCTLAKRRCGIPSAVMSLCIRSSPNRMPNSSSESRYSSAWRSFTAPVRSAEAFELFAEPRELLALRVDDLAGRALDEALVLKLALGAGDLVLEL